MEIFVASTSPHKIAATREAAKIAYPDKTLHVVGYKAGSGTNEQPVGHEQTLGGAENRLQNLKVVIGTTRYDLLVAMEGGMFYVDTPEGKLAMDCGWVVVENAQGQRAIAHSTGLRFPDVDVEEAERRGFATTTVGSVIAERGADGTDPHSFLSDGLLTRTDSLRQALLAALGQLRKQSAE